MRKRVAKRKRPKRQPKVRALKEVTKAEVLTLMPMRPARRQANKARPERPRPSRARAEEKVKVAARKLKLPQPPQREQKPEPARMLRPARVQRPKPGLEKGAAKAAARKRMLTRMR